MPEIAPNLPMSPLLPRNLWKSIAAAVSPAFADSYLSGAEVEDGKLIAKTVTAYNRLCMSSAAMRVLNALEIRPNPPASKLPLELQIWHWPSEAELAECTLRERHRQYRIMATECRNRAGPMQPDGTHLRPQFIAAAQRYDGLAKDCSKKISEGAQRRDS